MALHLARWHMDFDPKRRINGSRYATCEYEIKETVLTELLLFHLTNKMTDQAIAVAERFWTIQRKVLGAHDPYRVLRAGITRTRELLTSSGISS